MTLSNFLRRLLFHTTAASLVLSVILLIGEKLVPGSVLPFIDLIDLLPILLALIIAVLAFPPRKS